MTDNPISSAFDWYKENGLPPWATSLALAGLGYYGTKALWKPGVETARSLFRIPGRKMTGGDAEWDAAMDNLKEKDESKALVAKLVAGTTGLASALAMADSRMPGYGLWSWKDRMHKAASMSWESPYDSGMDWSHTVNAGVARSMFDDPRLNDDPYVRNLGTSIVQNAALGQHTTRPTLGGIFDSAVDKFGKKLSFSGIADVAVRSTVANVGARLFTGALGAMCDLSPEARRNIVDAGTWAGAIKAILN